MASFCYLFDKGDILFVLQFTRGEQLHQSVNKLVSCVKSVIASQRQEADGELDAEELDGVPVILFKTNLENMKSDIQVLVSHGTTEQQQAACKRLAEAGPKDIMSAIMDLYIRKCKVINDQLKYTGTVMKFEDNAAALYQGEPQVAHEMELLVSLFFPELNPGTK